ncbi:unnamed protein product [Brugia pahangi]|uniref:Ion_trans domain-containing protein n=1 Tax=Brugia pahangi TaxID=6280 RepID=A0A0N4TN28_BRUPA|nr:unnamed protein product [Brugia pahangi]
MTNSNNNFNVDRSTGSTALSDNQSQSLTLSLLIGVIVAFISLITFSSLNRLIRRKTLNHWDFLILFTSALELLASTAVDNGHSD